MDALRIDEAEIDWPVDDTSLEAEIKRVVPRHVHAESERDPCCVRSEVAASPDSRNFLPVRQGGRNRRTTLYERNDASRLADQEFAACNRLDQRRGVAGHRHAHRMDDGLSLIQAGNDESLFVGFRQKSPRLLRVVR